MRSSVAIPKIAESKKKLSAENDAVEDNLTIFDIKQQDIVLPAAQRLMDRITLVDDVPDIQFAPLALSVEVGVSSAQTAFSDHKGYYTTFGQEMDLTAKIESLSEQGIEFVHSLYTYRSVSQAIPEISIEVPANISTKEEEEIQAKKQEINRKVTEILRPEIIKLKELMNYVIEATGVFHGCILHLTTKELNKELVPEGIHFSLIKLLDTLVKLDNLKDIKTSLQKDFSRYKRAMGSHPSIEIIEELSQLQSFLSSPDPRKTKNYIFTTLRDEIKRIRGHENILLQTIELTSESLEQYVYLDPDEKFRLMRSLPYLMLIVDGELDDHKGVNIFKASKIKMNTLQKLFKKTPVVPLYGDMTVTIEYILARSPHYDRRTMGAAWGSEPDAKTAAQYDLAKGYWSAIRDSHAQYMVRFTAAMNRNRKYPFKKTVDEVTIEQAENVYMMVSEGFQKLSRWTTLVQQCLAWKYTHPADPPQPAKGLFSPTEGGGDSDTTAAAGGEAATVEGIEYARVLRYNFSKNELSVLVDVIAMIKSLASAMCKAEADLAPYIRFHIHHRIQQLVQGDLTPLLHRLDKRNKPNLPSLLKIRSLAADWLGGHEPRKDYKEYSRKQGSVFAKHPARVVSAADTQLFMLRTQIRSLYDAGSEVRRRTSVFARADLERSDIETLVGFHNESFYFPYLLHYSSTLRSVSDLGDLWFREFFLEMTKCIQFPIEMSMPWILTEHLLLKHVSNAPMIENVLFILDIYNDAAHRALYILNQQYLYDEIEAEANLVIDQMYFILSDEIYNHYKNLSASMLLEKSTKNRLEELKGSEYLTVHAQRFESLMAQKHVQLLGRSINLSYILAQNINNKIYRDIEIAIKRFESSDASGVVELKTFLDILRSTHARICSVELHYAIQLDSFDSMLHEVNESYAPSSFRGRISLHMLRALVNDTFPNFSYNFHTQRFVSSPIAIRPMEYAKAPKQSAVHQAMGSVCYKAFENIHKLTRGFFGRVHVEAFLSLGVGITDLSMIIDQSLQNLQDKLRDVAEYLDALKEGIPPTKFPNHMLKAVGSYGYYEGKLKPILLYDDLKPEVFQNIREIGNTIAFLRDLSDILELWDQFDFVQLAPFLGTTPASTGLGSSTSESNNNAVGSGGGGGGGAATRALSPADTSPLLAIINHLSNDIAASPALSHEVVRSTHVVAALSSVAGRLTENIYASTTAHKSLFKYVLHQIEELLYQLNLTTEWALEGGRIDNRLARSPNFGVEVENSKGFCRLWSALSFLFCMPESEERDSISEKKKSGVSFGGPEGEGGGGGEEEEDQDEEDGDALSNEAEFGHGFVVAGVVFLHLLNQRPALELMDFSHFVLRMHEQESLIGEDTAEGSAGDGPSATTAATATLGGGGGGLTKTTGLRNSIRASISRTLSSGHNNSAGGIPVGGVDPSLLKDASVFISAARAHKQLQDELFSLLAMQYTPRPSYCKLSINSAVFHPPDED